MKIITFIFCTLLALWFVDAKPTNDLSKREMNKFLQDIIFSLDPSKYVTYGNESSECQKKFDSNYNNRNFDSFFGK
ncbi:hypothetical protein PIROE2DRAFT_5778 [Piromyces sp. E2]|nr:hypothetical protein PIROE2DRAFT_5778 [Piromyces sp. E2]|eukprot:OUM66920.1 hypothetical protein PIROE2DRAFT_5778 [Piromyces sp. E2]